MARDYNFLAMTREFPEEIQDNQSLVTSEQDSHRDGDVSMTYESRVPDQGDNRALIVPVFSPSINAGTEFLSTLPKPEPVAARTVLMAQNQHPSFVHVVRSGIVKIICTNKDGEESIQGLRSEGWWAGAALALLNVPSLTSVVTLTACSISSIPVSEFSQKLIQNQRMLRHFISSQCRELMVEQQHGIMNGCSATERLAYLRDETLNSVWRTVDPTSVMRQGEIAKLLDITPEHLSRLLHKRPMRSSRPGKSVPVSGLGTALAS